VAREFDLLLLDYGGVCTPSHGEYLATTDPIDDVRPAALSVVEAAQANGLQVAILSNELDPNRSTPNSLLQVAGHVICGSDNKIFKPDRRAYQRALLLAGCEADRTFYVDDEPDNVAGAEALGMTAVLFDPTNALAQWEGIATRVGLEL